jgi:hypothetical protein
VTTVSSWLTLLTAVILVTGFLLAMRIPEKRTRIFGVAGTLALASVTGWFAWLSSTVV